MRDTLDTCAGPASKATLKAPELAALEYVVSHAMLRTVRYSGIKGQVEAVVECVDNLVEDLLVLEAVLEAIDAMRSRG